LVSTFRRNLLSSSSALNPKGKACNKEGKSEKWKSGREKDKEIAKSERD
jgi:hypothetical protein